MSSSDWLILATGPSSKRWPIPPGLKVATVNSGIELVHNPDAYGIFELNAGFKLHGRANHLLDKGVDVYLRPGLARMFDGLDRAHRIDLDFGPVELADLHLDVEWGVSPVPDYGQARAWISSGVLMLWILAEKYRPEKIYVAGLDGYPPEKDASKDYAEGLPNIGYHGLDSVDPVRRRAEMNKRMGEGIRRISAHPRYSDIEFIWLDETKLDIGTKARRITDSELSTLYSGWKDRE